VPGEGRDRQARRTIRKADTELPGELGTAAGATGGKFSDLSHAAEASLQQALRGHRWIPPPAG